MPEPTLPREFDSFAPPVDPAAAPPGDATPRLAEWTRTAGPAETLIMTGQKFSAAANADEGGDGEFLLYGQVGDEQGALKNGQILRLDESRAAVTVDESLPRWSAYMVWPVNAAGYGEPVMINAAEAWWVGPARAQRGGVSSLFGRNLSHDNSAAAAWIYLKPAGSASAGVWAAVKTVNPYKVDFAVPNDLANGSYEVWAHNGHGGRYGWSTPLTIEIVDNNAWNGPELNVKDFGARGDGVADDEAAIQAALAAAAAKQRSTIYFPAGTYSVSRGFRPPSDVRWRGDGADRTTIKLNANFTRPAAYDDRRYCLIFDSSASRRIEIGGMTLDADGNLKGYLDTLVHLRGPSEIRFAGVRFKAIGYKYFDLHLSSYIFLRNCEFVGAGGFLGNAKQVFVDDSRFLGTNDANTLLESWGSDGLSVTNSSARDYDNSTATGWAQGRFVYGNGVWGSNRHVYVGDCQTDDLAVRPGFDNQTSGEQLLWEGNATAFTLRPGGASPPDAIQLPPDFNEQIGDGRYEAIVVRGKGFGQHRRVVGFDREKRVAKVSPAWNLAPDSGSTVVIAFVAEKIALYRNRLDGKSDYRARDTASSGIQPYGNSYDFVADGNVVREVRTALSSWATDENNTIQPSYFNLFVNNDVQRTETGALANVEYAQRMSDDPGVSYFGNVFRRNRFRETSVVGFALSGAGAPPGRQLLMNVVEHNDGAHLPLAVSTAARPGEIATLSDNVVARNTFDRGQANANGSVGVRFAGNSSSLALDGNSWLNFAAPYADASNAVSATAPSVGAPYRKLTASVDKSAAAAQIALPLWNSGPAPLNWSANVDVAWLKLSPARGAIAAEKRSEELKLTADASSLQPGTYDATVTVETNGRRRSIAVRLIVNSTPSVTAPPVGVVPPAIVPPAVVPAPDEKPRLADANCEIFVAALRPEPRLMPTASEDVGSPTEGAAQFTYTFQNLQPGGAYNICLRLGEAASEVYADPARTLSVVINSAPVLIDFDWRTPVGVKPPFRSFLSSADAGGRITVDLINNSRRPR